MKKFSRIFFFFFFIFAQNIDCGDDRTASPRFHNLCFGSKIRKIDIPQLYYIKVGYKGIYIT